MTRQVVSKTKSKYIYSAAAAKKRAKLSNKSIQTKSIIQFNTKKCFMDKILSNSKLVFAGKISFSIYLWHYPIFALARYCQFLKEDEIEKKIFLIFLTFLLSIISYLLIEKPFRNNIKINNKKFWFSIAILAFSLTFFSLYLIKNKGFPERFPYIFHEERVIKKKHVKFGSNLTLLLSLGIVSPIMFELICQ
jgi:hypothetical protein